MNKAIDIRKITVLLGVFLQLKTATINGKTHAHVLNKESLLFMLLQREVTLIDVTNLYESYLKTSTVVGLKCHHKTSNNTKIILLQTKKESCNKKNKICTYHQNLKKVAGEIENCQV